jgi:hypothetical protein
MNSDPTPKFTWMQSILFHLLPGVLIGCFYFLIRIPVNRWGYPSIFALVLSIAFILIPVELGYLLFQGKKRAGRYTLEGMISYRKPIPWWQYILWVSLVFIVTGLIFTLLRPVDVWLKENIFYWVPDMNNGLDGNYSRTTLIVTYALFFIFTCVLGPWVEEYYFRGFLLPRVNGRFASLLHSFLFAAYHVFTPWMIITRTIGLLPLIYAVKKKNINVGIIAHILVNSIDFMIGIAFILNMA